MPDYTEIEMPNYKEMYLTLFRAIETVINRLITAQLACEELYISTDDPPFLTLSSLLEEHTSPQTNEE